MATLQWNLEKNRFLNNLRHVTFEDVVEAIKNKHVFKIEKHHNQTKYPNQHLIYFEFKDYIYVVPCIIKDDVIFLKTIYPSRKATKKYLKKGS